MHRGSRIGHSNLGLKKLLPVVFYRKIRILLRRSALNDNLLDANDISNPDCLCPGISSEPQVQKDCRSPFPCFLKSLFGCQQDPTTKDHIRFRRLECQSVGWLSLNCWFLSSQVQCRHACKKCDLQSMQRVVGSWRHRWKVSRFWVCICVYLSPKIKELH